jgi:hypothetical protein
MSMADRGTGHHYRYTRYVAPHAVLRFRERIAEAASAFAAYQDRELAKVLDEMVVAAIKQGHEEPIVDRGDKARLINIGNLDECPTLLYVLVKANRRSDPPEAIVSVLTPPMVQRLRTKAWDGPKLNTPFEVLRDFNLSPTAEAIAKGAEAHAVVERSIRNQSRPAFLITYWWDRTKRKDQKEIVSDGTERERVRDLIEEGAQDVRLWQEVLFTTETKTVTEVKF